MTIFPRLASTVVLMDQHSRVYLTKRPITMKFLGGYYVFPGGSVDPEDTIIKQEHIKNLEQNGPFNHAHYIAAARELFEEVGILLAENESGLSIKLEERKEIEYRRLLINGQISFMDMLKEEGLHLNLKSLTYFGHRITPEGTPIRFDTRFFLAYLPKEQFPKPYSKEVDDAFWIMPSEAIKAFQNGKLLMAKPTIHSLRAIINHQEGGRLMMS